MAITSIDYTLFRQLREHGALPLGGKLLELGEANWYGDVQHIRWPTTSPFSHRKLTGTGFSPNWRRQRGQDGRSLLSKSPKFSGAPSCNQNR